MSIRQNVTVGKPQNQSAVMCAVRKAVSYTHLDVYKRQGLLGMARSAGNCATEVAMASFLRKGYGKEENLYGLLHYLDDKLIPAMAKYNYKTAISPLDLILGLSGCHSSFVKIFEKVAKEEQVSLYSLIVKRCV